MILSHKKRKHLTIIPLHPGRCKGIISLSERHWQRRMVSCSLVIPPIAIITGYRGIYYYKYLEANAEGVRISILELSALLKSRMFIVTKTSHLAWRAL